MAPPSRPAIGCKAASRNSLLLIFGSLSRVLGGGELLYHGPHRPPASVKWPALDPHGPGNMSAACRCARSCLKPARSPTAAPQAHFLYQLGRRVPEATAPQASVRGNHDDVQHANLAKTATGAAWSSGIPTLQLPPKDAGSSRTILKRTDLNYKLWQRLASRRHHAELRDQNLAKKRPHPAPGARFHPAQMPGGWPHLRGIWLPRVVAGRIVGVAVGPK